MQNTAPSIPLTKQLDSFEAIIQCKAISMTHTHSIYKSKQTRWEIQI